MKKIVFIGVVVIVIAIAIVVGYLSFQTEQPMTDGAVEVQFAAETVGVPLNLVVYLQNSSIYEKYYAEGKNFVVYCVGEKCNYPKDFDEAILKLMENPENQERYNFVARNPDEKMDFTSDREREDNANFLSLCKDFCVVNPFRGEVFYISSIGEEEAKEFEQIFDGLKNW